MRDVNGLAGRVALVTGSGRGIGRAIALRLAREGADVAVHYHSSSGGADEVVKEIEALGRRSRAWKADVRSVSEVRRLVRDVAAHFGKLDVLVNNAGVEKRGLFWEVGEEDYDQVLDTNLKAVFFATQELVRLLREARRPGKVVMISSVHEDLPFPHFASYCASKGALRMLTRDLAIELAPLGITVNAIAPGAIATPINEKLLEDDAKRTALEQKIPLRRIGSPEDVAGVAAFLVSSDADYVTGSTYFVDGGLTWSYEEQ